MHNTDVARLFDEIADILDIQGANAFRVRAYRNGARTIEDLSQPVFDVAQGGELALTELPGIGKDLAQKILQLQRTGKIQQLEELRQQVPPGVLDMMRLPGLGPKKAAALFHEIGITSLEELKTAATEGRIAGIKGFGKKTEQKILEAIAEVDTTQQRYSIADARLAAETILADLKKVQGVGEGSVAGSCRRRQETCGDLDVLVTATNSTAAMDALAKHELVQKVLARGETKQRVRLHSGIELDLRVVPEESFGAALQYFTGSKEHNIVVRRRAQERGLKLNEYGLYRDDQLVAGRTEEEVYKAVGLPWIPPELRENRGEIETAEQGQLPRLLEIGDIQGDLHMHTTASDGAGTIREMIDAAKARGLKYIAITDHSKRVSMANGLDDTRLRQHWSEIRRIREEVRGIEVLCGIECDILEDATLDLDDEVLAEADWVIAVLHYGLRQPREQIMARLLNAIRNPHVCAIGHPSGRYVLKRRGADIDYPTFFKAAADHGVMLEINAHPSRLDLDDIHAAAARDLGIPIVIDTDSHSTSGFDVLQYGVDQARRAGLTKDDVANTQTFKQFTKMLRTKR